MGYKVTVNTINCSFEGQDDEGFSMDINNYSAGTYYLFLNCPDGYIFSSTPVLSYIDGMGFEDTENFVRVTDTRYTLEMYLDSDTIVDAVARVNRIYYSINTPDNVTVVVTDSNGFIIANDSLEGGTEYTITVTANHGYILNSGNVTYKDEDGFDTDDNLVSGTVTITPYSNITLAVVVSENQRDTWIIEDELSNASYSPLTIYTDEISLLSIIANDNYHFVDLPDVSYYDDEGFSVSVQGIKISDVRIDYHVPVAPFRQYNRLTLDGEAIQDTPVSDKYGIIKIYNPTTEELKALSRVRYIRSENGTVTVIDLGRYISKLFKLYCNIVTQGTGEINLGGYDTNVRSAIVTNYETTIDCGRVTITGFHENLLDYSDTTIDIFIPFVGDRTLDTVKVMDETIRLLYKVNVITGNCVAFITNSAGDTIYKFNGNMCFNIPYIMNVDDYKETSIKDIDASLMGFTPTVYIRSKKALIESEANSIQNNYKRDIIANFNGYHEFTDFFIDNSYIVDDEKQELKQLLETGVII